MSRTRRGSGTCSAAHPRDAAAIVVFALTHARGAVEMRRSFMGPARAVRQVSRARRFAHVHERVAYDARVSSIPAGEMARLEREAREAEEARRRRIHLLLVH